MPQGQSYPKFKYDSVVGHEKILQKAQNDIYSELLSDGSIDLKSICDTRGVHQKLFIELTPPGYSEYAGNYRGSNDSYLAIDVTFSGHVGSSYLEVEQDMEELAYKIKRLYAKLLSKRSSMTKHTFMYNIAHIASISTIKFIGIHPYADGNGHISRYITCGFMMPNGYIPIKWAIDPRPTYKEYMESMCAGHEKENFDKMTDFIIDSFKSQLQNAD
jgi:prophage maintenance system killer protein